MNANSTAQATDSSVRRPLSRRTFIAGVPVAALALAACATDSTPSTSTSSTTSSTAAAMSSTAATSAATGTATAGSVAALALAFQSTLSSDLQSTLLQDYSLTNAERWSNLPQSLLGGGSGGFPGGGTGGGPDQSAGGTGSAPTAMGTAGGGFGGGGSSASRLGITLTDLNDTQLASFNTLLKAATGSASGLGWAEIQQHLNADDYLSANGGGDAYGRANFFIAFLGTPADTGTWEFQFGGHHLAVANTYTDGALVGATPSFRGIEPNGQFTQHGTSNEPLAVKEAAFKALLAGMSADHLATAKLSAVYSDLVLGAGKDWAFPTAHEGVQVSALSADEQKLVVTAVASYVNDIADADAATILAKYTSELPDTYVAYSGTTALTELNDYIRIDGPSVWIEFSMQHGIVLSGNHPHSIWRDRNTDYGGTKS